MNDEINVSAKALVIAARELAQLDQGLGDAQPQIEAMAALFRSMAAKALNSACGDSITVRVGF